MRKALFAALIGLVVVAGGILWATRGSGSGVASEAAARDGAPDSQPSAAAAGAQSAPASVTRVPVGGAESRREVGRELTVLVVRKATGAPVPGATVAWRSGSMFASLPPLDPDESERVHADNELLVTRYGSSASAGADGTVRLPWPDGAPTFVARFGDDYAETWLDSTQPLKVLRLELARDRKLVVRVVGVGGEPRAGVRFWAGVARPGQPPAIFGSLRSAAGGVLVIPHLDVVLAQQGPVREAVQSGRPRIELRAQVLGQPAEPVVVDTERLPEEPVVVTLPPCAAVRVSLLDTEGKPRTPASEIATAALLGPVDGSWPGDAKQATAFFASDATATFPAVAVGKRLRVGASFGGIESVELDGPSADGQEVRVALRPAADAAILRGRAVGEDQRALADVGLRLEVEGNGRSGSQTARTDSGGRFECAFPKGWLPVTLHKAEWTVHDAQWVATGQVARLPVPWRLEAGVKDVGTLVFTRAPLLVGGCCVDRDGRPLVDAQIALVSEPFVEPGPMDPRPELPDGITSSLSGGKFVFRGTTARDDLRLRATCSGRVPSPLVAFARGASDVTIVLDRSGSMQGKVLHEPGVGPLLQLALHRSGAEGAPPLRGQMIFDWGPGGTAKTDKSHFECLDLPPGEYRLVFTLLGEAAPLCELRGVAVRGGEPCEDTRLFEVDLRGRLRVVKLAFTDASGKPIDADGGAVFAGSKNEGRALGFAVRAGKCEVPAVRLPADLRVRVPGYEPQNLPGVDGDREVRLVAQRELVVELTGVAAEDLEGVRVWVELSRERGGGSAPEGQYEVRDASWSCRMVRGPEPGATPCELPGGSPLRRVVRMPAAGQYSVVCKLEPARPDVVRSLFGGQASSNARALEKITPGSFAFDATAATPTLRIVLDAEEVRQKARALAR